MMILSQDDADNGSVNDEDYSYENVDDILEMVIFLRHAFVLSSLLLTQGD